MKRILILLALLFSWSTLPCWASATPFNEMSTSSTRNSGALNHGQHFNFYFPNPTLANNVLTIAVTWGDITTTISSLTDDKSNVYTQVVQTTDSTNGATFTVWATSAATAGAQKVTLTFSTTTTFVAAKLTEWYNTSSATLDGVACHVNASTTSWTPGSMTTGTSGDAIYEAAFDDTSVPWNAAGGDSITPAANFTMISEDVVDGTFSAYEIQAAAGAVNPTFTLSSSIGGGMCQVAIKSGSTGTAPSATAIRVNSVMANDINFPGSSTFKFRFPHQGNLLGLGVESISSTTGTCVVTAVTDTAGNMWTQRSQQADGGGVPGTRQFWDAPSSSATDITVTVQFGNIAPGQAYLAAFDVNNNGGFDASATGLTASGDQTVTGTWTVGTVTPSTSNGLVVGIVNQGNDTDRGVTPGNFITAWFDEADNAGATSGISDFQQDGILVVYYNPNTNAINFVGTNPDAAGTGGLTGVGVWSAAYSVYKANTTNCVPGLTLLKVGRC